MIKKTLILFIFLLLTLMVPVRALAQTNIIPVTVSTSQTGIAVPGRFIGFGGATPGICDLMKNSVGLSIMINLFNNLSPGVLNLSGQAGGQWSQTEDCNSSKTTPAVVDTALVFVRKLDNWKLIWGVHALSPLETVSVPEALYVAQKAGSSLLALQPTDEIDAMIDLTFPNDPSNPNRKQSYINNWSNLVSTVKQQYPSTRFAGPLNYRVAYYTQFLQALRDKNDIANNDSYPIGANPRPPALPIPLPEIQVEKMLSNDTMKNVIHGTIDPYLKVANDYHMPYRFAGNSTSGGGTNGSSNTFVSALWIADYMFNLLEVGGSGFDVWGAPFRIYPENFDGGYYLPIRRDAPDNIPFAKPIYYGILLFHFAASSGHVVPVQISTSLNISAHAILNGDGKLQVALFNKEKTATVSIPITTDPAYNSAYITRLSSPTLTEKIDSPSTSRITFGGSPVASDGKWSPSKQPVLNVRNGQTTVSMPPFSAAVITYQKGTPGDLNADGKVNIYDYNLLVGNFGKTGSNIIGDIDHNNKVDIYDYNILVGNFGK